MIWKLWGVLVDGQLWNLYFEINFEVLYLVQLSIFLKKNKIIGCRLFIKRLQPLVLAFIEPLVICLHNLIENFMLVLHENYVEIL